MKFLISQLLLISSFNLVADTTKPQIEKMPKCSISKTKTMMKEKVTVKK